MVQPPNMVKQFTMLQSVKIIQPIHKVQLVQLDPTSRNRYNGPTGWNGPIGKNSLPK